jgi:hypothetical protein
MMGTRPSSYLRTEKVTPMEADPSRFSSDIAWCRCCFPLVGRRSESIFLHAIDWRLTADVQKARRLGLVPVVFFQCLEQNFLFDILQTDTLFGQFEADVCNSKLFEICVADVRCKCSGLTTSPLPSARRSPSTSPSLPR